MHFGITKHWFVITELCSLPASIYWIFHSFGQLTTNLITVLGIQSRLQISFVLNWFATFIVLTAANLFKSFEDLNFRQIPYRWNWSKKSILYEHISNCENCTVRDNSNTTLNSRHWLEATSMLFIATELQKPVVTQPIP